jgi:hypothetical protein
MIGQFDQDGDLWINAIAENGVVSKLNLSEYMRGMIRSELGDEAIIQLSAGEVAEVRRV